MALPKQEAKVEDDNMNKDASDYDPKNASKMNELYMQRVNDFERSTCRFPIETNSIIYGGFDLSLTYKHMTQTYPICHGSVLLIAYQFLLCKREFGTSVEKALYKNMTLIEFFDRISTKRAVVFYQKYDSYMLRNGRKGASNWEAIGTEFESIDDNNDGTTPLLSDYLSYDELLISSLCGISSPTYFINNGNRHNRGHVDNNNKNKIYPLEAIYMGLIGARFEKQYCMEYSLMIITNDQNKEARGYGYYDKKLNKNMNLNRLEKCISDEYFINQIKSSQLTFKESKPIIRNIFESFYSREYFPLYDEVKSLYNNDNVEKIKTETEIKEIKNRYFEDSRRYGNNKPYLDVDMFQRRIRISLELFLFDSDKRALNINKKAFCHLVGLGSGYWSFNKTKQDQEMVRVILSIINDSNLINIECIYFSWFDDTCDELDELNKDNNTNEYYAYDINKHKIIIQFGDRDPADKLNDKYNNCLICACYAWDSNAFPGNEYWLGNLNASGDPAAAACSTISYVQNSEINKEYINGKNTMFYFFNQKNGKYQFIKLKDMNFEKNKKKWLIKSVLSIPYKRKKFVIDNNNDKNNDNDEKSNKSNL